MTKKLSIRGYDNEDYEFTATVSFSAPGVSITDYNDTDNNTLTKLEDDPELYVITRTLAEVLFANPNIDILHYEDLAVRKDQ